ncbi:hypothetical protein QM155_04915 [Enterobacter hormaechei]|uniref:hypothetical protein n=1 Tax=Enterobacter hormaechei TaxID=158836 RepID=UPI002948C8E6|nr:hypothetical protein [Enterobacter hormaechei]MDV5486548.1 hypothetical protein [Enterobacter hormaechei]MDV5520341.1 hypothetical protein [Enterobacter hormaechei]MDV5521894.1 hypothetical protein [Enterobacter hormaechei]MDV5535954.1 hypothetical protein [Enterobacter hormaechei]MDV5553090.1 hypothetical protein [Enterobacter hormaechei]
MEGYVSKLRELLDGIPANKRLHVIAEALCDLNPSGDEAVLQASCGCYDWDINIDYRNADIRYAVESKGVQS